MAEPPQTFANKVYTVTGGARGIGLGVSRHLAARGATVCIADVRADELATAEKELARDFPRASVRQTELDVRDGRAVEEWMEGVVSELGRVDGCVNNAGVPGHWKPIVAQTDEDWDTVIGVNIKGVFNCLRAQLSRVEKGGSIVNIASVAGLIGFPHASAYVTSKHGVVGMTKCAALEVGADGTRVNAICPGLVDTAMIPAINRDLGGLLVPEKTVQIFKRYAKPEEIAALVGYLLSDDSKFVTGAALPIDAGYTAG